jgi:hypothetical protein
MDSDEDVLSTPHAAAAAAASDESSAIGASLSTTVLAATDTHRLKRKRKDAPMPSATSQSLMLDDLSRTTDDAPPIITLPPLSLESHLLSVPAVQHSTLQNEVLTLMFGAKGSHAAHLYRNLPGPQPISITRSCLPTIQSNDYWVSETTSQF